MNVQQVSVKVFAEPDHGVTQDEYIPIFHKWIREHRIAKEQLLIDVADYKHVHHGPGIMIIGHTAHWAMDEAEGALGVQYHRKRDALGPASEKLHEALRDALEAAIALQDEPAVSGRLAFGVSTLSFRVSSRLAVTNTAESRASWEQELRAFLGSVASEATLSFQFDEDPKASLGATVTLAGGPDIRTLYAAL